MPKQAEIHPNQMVLRCSSELVPEAAYEDLDPEKRRSLYHLVSFVLETVPRGHEPATDDYFHAEPNFINQGLYVSRNSAAYSKAQHTIWLGVPNQASHQAPQTGAREHQGVVFPPTEYSVIARNARDLARSSVSKTARAQLRNPSPTEAHNTAMRSAGHTLTAKRSAQDRLLHELDEQHAVFKALYLDITQSHRTRYKVRNLEKKRALADEKIHETIEVASPLLELEDAAVAGLHRAVRRNLYNGNYSNAQFSYNWLRYLVMVGHHNAAKQHKLQISRVRCEQELDRYIDYIRPRTHAPEAQAA